MPDDIKALADRLVQLTGEAEAAARELKALESGITDEVSLQPEERDRLEDLRKIKRRIDRELSRVRTQYQDKLASWRHRE